MVVFSKVIVRSYASETVHVYDNAALYMIRRTSHVKQMCPKIIWYTIRARKNRNEKFRTLVDMCGKEVEFLLLTKKIVKMIYNEEYEYTLHFDTEDHAAYFVNIVYPFSKKASGLFASKYYELLPLD